MMPDLNDHSERGKNRPTLALLHLTVVPKKVMRFFRLFGLVQQLICLFDGGRGRKVWLNKIQPCGKCNVGLFVVNFRNVDSEGGKNDHGFQGPINTSRHHRIDGIDHGESIWPLLNIWTSVRVQAVQRFKFIDQRVAVIRSMADWSIPKKEVNHPAQCKELEMVLRSHTSSLLLRRRLLNLC